MGFFGATGQSVVWGRRRIRESPPEEMIREQRKGRLLPARVTVYELVELLMRERGYFVAFTAHAILHEDFFPFVGGHHDYEPAA